MTLVPAYPSSSSSHASASVHEGTVVKIADGDTVTTLDADKVQHRVRIAAVGVQESQEVRGGELTLPVIFDRIIKPYILILALIFAASFLAGTLAPASVRNEVTKAFQFVTDSYRGLAGGTLFFSLLFNNVIASTLILVSGVLIGIIPVLSIGANGFVLGVVYRQTAEMVGYSKAGLMVLPHGVFEIPALPIAASYGLWLGVMVVWRMRGKESTPLRFHIAHAFRRYYTVMLPLLIVAAGIETTLIL